MVILSSRGSKGWYKNTVVLSQIPDYPEKHRTWERVLLTTLSSLCDGSFTYTFLFTSKMVLGVSDCSRSQLRSEDLTSGIPILSAHIILSFSMRGQCNKPPPPQVKHGWDCLQMELVY